MLKRKEYVFFGCNKGIESITEYAEVPSLWFELRGRYNPDREYYWGVVQLDESVKEGLLSLSPIEMLRLIMKTSYELPKNKVREFLANMEKASQLYEKRLKIEKESKKNK